MRRPGLLVILLVLLALPIAQACRPDTDRPTSGAELAVPDSASRISLPPGDILDASSFVDSIYRVHFREGSGFGHSTLLARQSWFSPVLFELLETDLRGPDIGVLDFDPFIAAQDDPERYAIAGTTTIGDSTLVEVTLSFPASVGHGSESNRVTIYLTSDGNEWRIANIVNPAFNLLERLRTFYSGRGAEPDTAVMR